jgi:hypothetical protein
MNTAFRVPPNGFFLPDPWSIGVEPYPAGRFEDFYHYVRRNVQEHSRDKMVMSKSEHLAFLTFMMRNGLSWDTLKATLAQLWRERGGHFRWQRAMILDRMQWDIFAHLWKRERPDFSTFFINSTAHFQHMYWRNMDPGPFRIQPTESEQAEYRNAVLAGYQNMDALVGRCLEMAGPETTVILATALSQQPCLKYEEKSGKVGYRAIEPDDLFAFAGIDTDYRYAPVMSEQFHLYFKDESGAVEAKRLLLGLMVEGQPLMYVKQDGHEVMAGCVISEKMRPEAAVRSLGGATRTFGQLFYQAGGLKSGMHHPDGILWIRDQTREPNTSPRRVSLCHVAPTLLAHFGLPRQEFMTLGPLPGYEEELKESTV